MKIVVDTNLLVALMVPLDYSVPTAKKFREWIEMEAQLFAPALWTYEAVSAVRKFVAGGTMTLLPNESLHHEALVWAGRLDALVAYDAYFLALAEYLGAHFWTADRKLVRKAESLGIEWIHDIKSASNPP